MRHHIAKKIIALALGAVLMAGSVQIPAVGRPVQAAEVERVGEQKEIPGTVSSFSDYDTSFLSVTGYAAAGVHDRSQYVAPEYAGKEYRTVSDEREFLEAVTDAGKGQVKVIEITKDLFMGPRELNLTEEEQQKYSCISSYGDLAYTNPVLEASGVSNLNFSDIDGLTVFSRSGVTIKHVTFKLQASSNDLVFRNLKFDEMWQWDVTGNHKEAGWAFVKINGAKNVWIDHCTFTIAADGNIDLENGASGVTFSWCEFGLPTVVPEKTSAIYKTITYMEQDRRTAGARYTALRDGGATAEDIMKYEAIHDKVHLTGSGDKDWKDESESLQNGNPNLQLTLAYNEYTNVSQRVPMIRQGQGHVFNCYFNNMGHFTMHAQEPFTSYGKLGVNRCMDARDGASIGVDTCVFYGVDEPITGDERQGDETTNLNAPWDSLFAEAMNRVLIVNSKTTNTKGETSTGSSWDKNGENQFTKGYQWYDKSTLNHWAWKSTILGVRNSVTGELIPADTMTKAKPTLIPVLKEDGTPETTPKGSEKYEPFEIAYDMEAVLPYEYKMVPLETVQETVQKYNGAYTYDMSAENWLRTTYGPEEDIQPADASVKHPVESMYLTEEDSKLSKGGFLQLNAYVTPSNATNKDIVWTSDNEAVAVVFDSGLVKAVGNGEAVITATSADDAKFTQSVKITVGKQTQPVPDFTYGDVTGDEKITSDDALTVLKAVVKLIELDENQTLAADVTGDGKVTSDDALEILKHVVKLIDSFQAEKG